MSMPPSGFQPPHTHQPYATQTPYAPPPVSPPSAPPASGGLATVAMVIALVSLLLTVGLIAWTLTREDDATGDDPGFSGPLTGQLSNPAAPFPGGTLAEAVSKVLTDDGGAAVQELTCPDTPRVARGIVTVCHGTLNDADWALVVVFEDDARFTVVPA